MYWPRRMKEHEWEEIVSNRKTYGTMLNTDTEFDCADCGQTIDYDEYVEGEGAYTCPFCGKYILPYAASRQIFDNN